MKNDIELLSLQEKIDYYSPALGLDMVEADILISMVSSAPRLPSLRGLERGLGLKRSYTKKTFMKLERMGLVKISKDIIDFSGLIHAISQIPSSEKKRLYDELNEESDSWGI